MPSHLTLAIVATISPALVGAVVVILLGGVGVAFAFRRRSTGQMAQIQRDLMTPRSDVTTPSSTTGAAVEEEEVVASSIDVQRRLSGFTADSEPRVERWFRDRQGPGSVAAPAEDAGIVVLHPSNPALANTLLRNGTTGTAGQGPSPVRNEPIPLRPVAGQQDAAEPISLSGDEDVDNYADHSELSTGPLGALPPASGRD